MIELDSDAVSLINGLEIENKKMHEALSAQRLTNKIREWAIFHGLDMGDSYKQVLKLGEEYGELCQALVKGYKDSTKDAIGDMYVVLTILAMQNGTSIEECANIAYDEIKDRKGKMVNGVFVKEDDL